MNAPAAEFFEVSQPDKLNGSPIGELSPEINRILEQMPRGSRLSDGEAEIRRPGKPARTLLIRVSSELAGAEVKGYVVTFDDVTELVSAQRKAAWSDIARRIAHEIKNPLTPIQLSAERLPAPVMKEQEIRELCRQTVLLQSSGRGDIRYTQDLPPDLCVAECDVRQIGQALTNMLKNAAEAIDARPLPLEGQLPNGEIRLQLKQEDGDIVLSVEDNGKGLPIDERHKLTEPYVTTRSKGTGLGLAIVKKIMEDHHGELILADRPRGGAIVSLIWPLRQPREILSDDQKPDNTESQTPIPAGAGRRA